MSLDTYKPDIDEAVQRWEAFYAGELIDRPPVVVTAPRKHATTISPLSYREKVFDDLDVVVGKAEKIIENTFWGGEAVPTFYPSFGPDEIAVFTGAELRWSLDSADTNWSLPYVEDWEKVFPIRINPDHPLWQRQLSLYRKAADRFGDKVLLVAPDLHTNMDLLAAIRSPQKLCMDLLDSPQLITQAMIDSRNVFKVLWESINSAGRMPETGYALESHALYSRSGSATIQCDFSIMMSPGMFIRWVLPALEEEASLVSHVVYHWDGPGALIHQQALLSCSQIHTLSFVPGAGNGEPVDHIEILKNIQDGGKSIHVWGTPDECKKMHKELRPDRVFYCTTTDTQAEAESLLDWFVKNT